MNASVSVIQLAHVRFTQRLFKASDLWVYFGGFVSNRGISPACSARNAAPVS